MHSSSFRQHWHAHDDPKKTAWLSPEGWYSLFRSVTGLERRRILDNARKLIATLTPNQHHPEQLGEAQIAASRRAMRAEIHASERISPAAMECLALLYRLAQRALGLTPSLPQVAAVIAMVEGRMVQLAPGEGKTLVIAITAIMYSWKARPCHVVTANEYLASRDAAIMAPLFSICGIRAVAVTHDTPPHELVSGYSADVVYATANQLLADFLRDGLLLDGAPDQLRRRLWAFKKENRGKQPVMRGLHVAIIDEADGVLIDEATTPLIISLPEEDTAGLLPAVSEVHRLAKQLQPDAHYTVFRGTVGAVQLTPSGRDLVNQLSTTLSDYWQQAGRSEDLFKLALMAKEVYQRDRHYILQEDKVLIVDENTGRSMPGRSWSHGVHQSIEVKEGVELTPPSKTVARMTFQDFFRHYHVLCGASGTLHGLDFEMWKTFGVGTVRIPPRIRSRLQVYRHQLYRTRAQKLEGFIEKILELHALNLPVLVGTRRILDSEEIAAILKSRGHECTVLNAKEHAFEAQIIAKAGLFAAITVATNMAGRGTDITLAPEIEKKGGLQVLMFETHESARVDWQLFGRAARQGAQGSAQAFASLEEEVISKALPYWASPLKLLSRTRIPLRWVLPLMLKLSQGEAQRRSAAQRRQLAFVQTQLRKHLGFVRG